MVNGDKRRTTILTTSVISNAYATIFSYDAAMTLTAVIGLKTISIFSSNAKLN